MQEKKMQAIYAWAWDDGEGFRAVEDAKTAKDAARSYYEDHPDEWEEGKSIDVHKVKKKDTESFLCINAYDDLLDIFYEYYGDNYDPMENIDQDDINRFIARRISEYLKEKKVNLNFWDAFGDSVTFQSSDFKHDDLWKKSIGDK